MSEPTSSASKRKFGMADVAAKPVTRRRALAVGTIHLGDEAFRAVADGALAKGDALAIAEIAGIQAAKATATLLPLCHPIALSRVVIYPRLDAAHNSVRVYCLCEITERTGVEMEALSGVSVALLNVWDLTKPINPALEIGDVKLLFKSGGKRGDWQHPEGLSSEAREILAGHLSA